MTSAASLIQGVVHHYADDYKGCVQLAVSRLSRVRLAFVFNQFRRLKFLLHEMSKSKYMVLAPLPCKFYLKWCPE